MKAPALLLIAIFSIAPGVMSLWGQTFARSPSPSSTDAFQVLARKIDEQNAKIDMLSQQILKLQQELASGARTEQSSARTEQGNSRAEQGSSRSGVMIGEGAPASSPASSISVPAPHSSAAPAGNTHTVSRGETLTSIAKMYKVTVDELQKFNHIENPLKLQVGQTIMIPGSPSPAPSAEE